MSRFRRILGEEPLTFDRFDVGVRDPVQGYISVYEFQAQPFLGYIEEAPWTAHQKLTDADRNRDPKLIITKQELRAVDQITQKPADIVWIDGWPYDIYSATRIRHVLPHYECLALRVLCYKPGEIDNGLLTNEGGMIVTNAGSVVVS